MLEPPDLLSSVYARFAEQEAATRSPLYVEICRGIASDAPLLARLAGLPPEKQQPNLLLAALKYLCGTARDWPHFRTLAEMHWDDVRTIILSRRTQTNEAARCATLLPLLAQLPQPLALLEVGASAGLCLLPDFYGYDYGARQIVPSQPSAKTPVFHCTVNAATPLPARNLDVIWRAGLDLNPLDATNDDDVRWLEALVWPGEGERARLLAEALAVARQAPPRIVKGDLSRDVAALAAQAPKDATLVIFHTAVLSYVSDAGRAAFGDCVRDLGAQWVSNESTKTFSAHGLPPLPWGRFLLSWNGRPMAFTDPHGTAMEWIA